MKAIAEFFTDAFANPVVRLAVAGGALYTMGDWFIKKWSLTGKPMLWIIGMMLWMGGMAVLASEFKNENMAVASLAISLGNMLLLVLMSWFVFHEPLSASQLIGVGLGMGSMWFLNR
jgi:multidrug transporter EmrE-like cation transporter